MSGKKHREMPVPVPDTAIWTTDEVAAFLKISPDMVRLEARRNRLPGAFQIGTLWRFHADKVKDFGRGTATAA